MLFFGFFEGWFFSVNKDTIENLYIYFISIKRRNKLLLKNDTYLLITLFLVKGVCIWNCGGQEVRVWRSVEGQLHSTLRSPCMGPYGSSGWVKISSTLNYKTYKLIRHINNNSFMFIASLITRNTNKLFVDF